MEELATALRNLVNPEKTADLRVRDGCDFLYNRTTDEQLIELAKQLVCEKRDIEDSLRLVFPDPTFVIDQSLYLATVRYRIKAVPFAEKLGGSPTTITALEKRREQEYRLPKTFAEADSFEEAIQECCIAPEYSDPLRDMAFLIEVQKRRLLQQLKDIVGSKEAFAKNKQFNATVESLKTLIKEMAKMQVEFGLRQHVPRQIDLRIQGAFQTFLNSVGDERDSMATLTRNILSLLEEDVVDAEFSESSHG